MTRKDIKEEAKHAKKTVKEELEDYIEEEVWSLYSLSTFYASSVRHPPKASTSIRPWLTYGTLVSRLR